MMLTLLVLIPLFGILSIACLSSYENTSVKALKIASLSVTVFNLILSLVVWILSDNSSKYYQFVTGHYNISYYDIYLGLDGLSIYFVLLTTLITPIAIMSNWKSISRKPVYYLVIILLLESALLLIFLVLDILMFYIFFESILAPLFILIGIFGSSERIRAGFYFFLYTFLGSLFMLLSIITMLSLIGTTDNYFLSKPSFVFITQIFLFIGIFIAFAVKTPVIYLNGWLLKAHVESPLSGSIILAAIVLKLSLYGVFRLILPIVPKAYLNYTFIVFIICLITIAYASLSTIRTIDVKELIAYSSVSHAVVYLGGIISNTLHGIQGGIALGLAHGFVSSGLFITAGGVLYDRSSTRLISYYKGITQAMPILSILYFMLSLGNCGAPLTLNFVGEFMSLYGMFERLPIAGILCSSSIVFSAAYTIYMYNRISFAGSYQKALWDTYMPDLNKREFGMLIILVLFTIALGIYPSIILDSLHYVTQGLLHTFSLNVAYAAEPETVTSDEHLQTLIEQNFYENERLKSGRAWPALVNDPINTVKKILEDRANYETYANSYNLNGKLPDPSNRTVFGVANCTDCTRVNNLYHHQFVPAGIHECSHVNKASEMDCHSCKGDLSEFGYNKDRFTWSFGNREFFNRTRIETPYTSNPSPLNFNNSSVNSGSSNANLNSSNINPNNNNNNNT